MNWQSISPILRVGLLLGAVCYLALILWLLKKKKLTVRYSIIWLISAGVLLVFAVFPYVVLVLTDLLGMAVPVNVVFLLVIAFILLLLLSLSSIVSGFAEKIDHAGHAQGRIHVCDVHSGRDAPLGQRLPQAHAEKPGLFFHAAKRAGRRPGHQPRADGPFQNGVCR